MPTSENDICIRVKCQAHNKKEKCLTESRNGRLRVLDVVIPLKTLGIDETISLRGLCKAQLKRCLDAGRSSYNLNVQFDNHKRATLKLHCTSSERGVCDVQLVECYVRLTNSIKVLADKITTRPNKTIVCNGRLVLESKLENRVQSKLRCQYVGLSSGTEVRLSSEANVQSNCLHISAKTAFIDGKVSFLFSDIQLPYPTESANSDVSAHEIVINGDLHIGRDGLIGSENQLRKSSKRIATILNLVVSGNISNFGKIQSANEIKIKCKTLLSCLTSGDVRDTAHRFYNAILSRLGEQRKDEQDKDGTGIKDAILNGDKQIIDYCLMHGEDPNASSDGESPTQMAERLWSKAFIHEKQHERTEGRMKEEASNMVIKAWNKRFGSIISSTIICEMSGALFDLNQFSCNDIALRVQGDVVLEEHSICTLGYISGYCKGYTRISGSLKMQGFKQYETRGLQITDSGIIVIDKGGDIKVTEHFINNNIIWNCKDSLSLATGIFEQGEGCLFKSGGNLNISIQTESNNFRGFMETESVSFLIGALVVENCCIQAIKKCKVEMQGHEKQFCKNRIHHKGLVEVQNGALEVISPISLYAKREADVIIEGEIVARGLYANTAFVTLESSSIATIYPDAEVPVSSEVHSSDPQCGAKSDQQITFQAGKLVTDVGSQVKFIGGEKDTIVMISCHSLKHNGKMLVEQNINLGNFIDIETALLEYNGKFQNVDRLGITVSDKMIVRANLTARERISIAGKGQFQNYATIKCDKGPLTIHENTFVLNSKNAMLEGQQIEIRTSAILSSVRKDLKYDMRNRGIIKSFGSILIDCKNIDNYGRIESSNSEVQLHWRGQSKKTTKLRGTVISPIKLTFSAYEASSFHCKCFGGNQSSPTSLYLPKQGMTVKCYRGSVILHNCIEGDADLTIQSMKGLCVLNNVTVPQLIIRCDAGLIGCNTVNETNQNYLDSKEDDALFIGNEVLYFSCTSLLQEVSGIVDKDQNSSETNAKFYISNGSVVSVRHIISTTNHETMHLYVQTANGGELFVDEKFFNGSTLVLDGCLSISQSTELVAKKILFCEESICKITTPKIEKEKTLCTFFADADISLFGRVYNTGSGRFHVRIQSENGNVYIKGNVSLPELLVISGPRMCVSIESQIDIQSDIKLAQADQITVFPQSRINCTTLSYQRVLENDTNKTVRISLNGYVHVNGPVEFEDVNTITMNGVLKAKGISATTANVRMREKAYTCLFPDNISMDGNDSTIFMNICSLGNLSTETNSVMMFITNGNTTNYMYVSTWEHRGSLEIVDLSDERNKMEVYADELINHGQLKKIDSLLIRIDKSFSNYSNIFVQDTMSLKGRGNVHNNAILQCNEVVCKLEEVGKFENSVNGHITSSSLLRIVTQSRVQNHGTMACNNKVQVETESVQNTGLIESLNSTVDIKCNTKREANIDVVKSRTQFNLIVPNGEMLSGSCTGGNGSEEAASMIQQKAYNKACPGELENSVNGRITSSSLLRIVTQTKVQNHGTITCKHKVQVATESVQNTGLIESLNSTVDIQYKTKWEAIIDGVVKSPTQINLIVPQAEMMYCRCTGGNGNDEKAFVIPQKGFNIECPKGTIVLESNIDTGDGEADLYVVCGQICTIRSNVTVKTFNLRTKNSNVGMKSGVKYSYPNPNCLLLKDYSKLATEVFVLSSNDDTLPFCVITEEGSHVFCDKKIHVNTDFNMKGQLQISSSCTLQARGLKLDVGTTCTVVTPFDHFVEENSEIKEKPSCTIHIDNDIQLFGNFVYKDHERFMVFLASKNGNVKFNGITDVSYLTVIAGKDIKISNLAVVRCQAFECIPSKNSIDKAQSLIISGNLQVTGPIHCAINTVHLTKEGALLISSTAETENVVFEACTSAIIEGCYKCNIVGYCVFECADRVSFANQSRCVISAKECIFAAYEMISMDSSCEVELLAGKLHLTNAKENDKTIHGKIHLNGKITVPGVSSDMETATREGNATESMLEIEGQDVRFDKIEIQQFKVVEIFAAMSFVMEASSVIQYAKKVEIQATDIEIMGKIGETKSLELIAENTLMISKTGMLHDGDNLKILTTCSEIKGKIHCYKHVNCSLLNLLILGEIKLVDEIKVEADTAFVNNGELHGVKTGIVAPITINCPSDFKTTDIVIPNIGGKNQKELIIEGLLCINVGTYIQAININIKSALSFQFSSKLTTVPDHGDLDRWKSIVDSSLTNLNATRSHTDIENLVKQAMKIPQVLCNLNASSHLCNDIVQISQNIRIGGLNAFKMEDLIHSLHNAHNMYSAISVLQIKTNVRIKFRSFKKRCENVARKLINKMFGPNSFSSSFEFQLTDQEIKPGIHTTFYLHEGDHTSETISGGAYTAIAMQINGIGGSWKSGGHLEACGDILISASIIEHTGGPRRLLRAITGAVKLKADNINVQGVQSAHLNIEATQDLSVDNVESKKMVLKSSHGNVSLDGKIEADKAQIEASEGTISLTGKCGKADHKFGSLNITAGNIKDIENILNTSDVYRDLEISDHLGLFVEDQDVILANKTKSQFSITLKAASIDVRGDIEAKNVTLEATKGGLNTWKNVNIKTKENLSLKAQKDLIFSQGSSVEAGTGISFYSTSGSVRTFATNIDARSRINIKAYKDIEITSTGSSGPCQRSTIHAGSTDHSQAAISMNSGNDIKIHASDVSSQGKIRFQADNDILITAHTYETTRTEHKSAWLGLKTTKNTTTTTHVQKPKICGSSNSFLADGKFKSIAGQINSEYGTNIRAKGSVAMLDIVATTRVETESKVFGGLLAYNKRIQQNENSHGTVVEDTSSQAQTSIFSETSDIEWVGSSIKTPGDFKETARCGKVKHSNRILTNTDEEWGYGFCVALSADQSEQGTGFKVGFDIHSKHESYQETSKDEISVGGNYEVTAQGLDVLNAVDIDVKRDMNIDATDVWIEGAEIKTDVNSFQLNLGLNRTEAALGIKYNQGKKTSHQALNLQTGGKLRINAQHVKCVGVTADVGSFEGHVGELEVKTRENTESKTGFGLDLGVDIVTRTPSVKVDFNHLNSKKVDQSSVFKIRDSSKGLSINRMSFIGAALVFDGDVHEFASQVVSQEVHETFHQIKCGFTASKQNLRPVAKTNINVQCSWGRYGSCIASKNGAVDESISKQINTDLDKRRQEDGSFQLSFAHEFECSLSKHISSICKSLVKDASKEGLTCSAKFLAKELGLKQDVIEQTLKLIKDGITKQNVISFFTSNLAKGCLPKGLMEELEVLFIDGNPTKLIVWLSEKANVDKSLLGTVIAILHNKKTSKETLQIIIDRALKYFMLSEELCCIISSCLNFHEDKGSSQTSQHTTLAAVVNCPEGQKVFHGICNLLDIDANTAELVFMLLKQNNAEKGLFFIGMIGTQLGISTDVLNVLKEVVLTNDPTKLVQYGCKQLGFDGPLTSVLLKTITASKNLKSIALDLMKDISNHFGISDKIIGDLQKLIGGKFIDRKRHFLLLQILIQVGKSSLGRQSATETVNLLEDNILYIKSSNEIVEDIISFGEQIKNGDIQTDGIQFVLFLCRLAGVSSDTGRAIECLLTKDNTNIVLSWLSTFMYTIDQDTIRDLVDTILNDCGLENMVKILLKHFAGKWNVSLTSQDLDKIIAGKMCCGDFQTVFPTEFANLVIIFQESDEPEHNIEKCFHHLVISCGVPEQLAHGFKEFVLVGKSERMSEWIGEQTSIPSPIVSFVLDYVRGKNINQEMINWLIDNTLNTLGLTQLKGTMHRALRGQLCKTDIEKLILQILAHSLMPHVRRFMAELKFPCKVIENVEKLFFSDSPCDPYELGFSLLEILVIVAGMPNDLMCCLKSVAIENDCGPLSTWISNLSGIEQGLVLLVLQTLKDGKRTIDGLMQLPMCIARYYKLSENTIGHVQCLLKGKIPKCGIVEVIVDITKDASKHLEAFYPECIEVLFSIIGTKDWMERSFNLLGFLATKFDISVDIIEGTKDLVKKGDASKLGICLAEKVGINKNIVIVLLNALIQKQSIKQIIRHLGQIAGIPDSAMAFIDELIKAHCDKNRISEFWTDSINWKSVCQSVTSVVGKEILEKQLGVPVGLVDIASGDTSIENAITTLSSILGKMGIPADFVDLFEDLVKNGDPRTIINFICKRVNLDTNASIAILETIQSKQSALNKLMKIMQYLSKMLGISEEFLSTIDKCVRYSLDKNSKRKTNMLNTLSVFKTPEGQRFARKIGEILEVPQDIIDLILSFIAEDGSIRKGFFLVQILLSKLGMSKTFIHGMKGVLTANDPIPLMQWGFEQFGFETSLIREMIKTLRDRNKMTSALPQLVKIVATHFGISLEVVQSTERILKGQWPKHGTANLILQMLRDFGKSRCGQKFTKVIVDQFSKLLSITVVPDAVVKEMYTLSTKAENVQNAAITIIVFLLNKSGISADFVSKTERFLRHRDPDILMLFLSKASNINKSVATELVNILLNGCDIRKLLTYFISCLSKKFNLSKNISEDIELMFYDKNPQHELKELVCVLHSTQEIKLKELVDGFCRKKQINIGVSYLIQVLCNTGQEKKNTEVFVLIACKCGLDKCLAKSLGSLVISKNCDEFSEWIQDKTSLKKQWVVFILEMLLQPKFDKRLLVNTMSHVVSLCGLPKTYTEKLSVMMNGQLSKYEVCTLLFQMTFEIVSPALRKIADTLQLPTDIIDIMTELLQFHDQKEFTFNVTKILMEQAGMPTELFLAIKKAACDHEYVSLAIWVSEKSGADKELMLAIFQNITDESNLTDILCKIPRSIAQYLKLSEKTIEFIECLMKGKIPNSTAADAIAIVAKDIAKIPYIEEKGDIFSALLRIISAGDGMQMTFQLLHYLSSKHGISSSCIDGIHDLLQKSDPTQLAEIVADKLQIDKNFVFILANALIKGGTPKQIVKHLLDANEMPDVTIDVIEHVLKTKGPEVIKTVWNKELKLNRLAVL